MDINRKRFGLTLGVLTLLRLGFIGRFELSPDEAYYWTWSRHLDWSYYDQGPMLAWVIRLFTGMTGSATEWSVRLGAVVLSALTAWLFFEWVSRSFKSTRVGWMAFLGLQAALLFSAGSILMMHDTVMMFFWVGALAAFDRALFEDWIPGWLLGGLALGLGGLSKYTMALFVPGLLLFLAVSPAHRVQWRRPYLYLAGLVAAACTLPVWVWNAGHQWASFGHIGDLSGAGQKAAVTWKYLPEFLGGQVGVMTPLLGAFALAAPVLAWRWRNRAGDGGRQLFYACSAGAVLGFFLLLSLHTRIYANWTAPAYPAALAILAGWLETASRGAGVRRAQAWARASLILGAVLTLAVHALVLWTPAALPGRVAESLDRVRGWRALGAETGRRLEALAARGDRPSLAARRYQVAAVLSFYAPGQPEVELFPIRRPAGNQYRFWDRSAELAGRDLLLVCEDEWEVGHFSPYFRSVEPLGVWADRDGGRIRREIRFYLGRGYDPRGPEAVGFARLGTGEARP